MESTIAKNTVSTSSNRIEYIDIFKGIAIILVVLQHCIGSGFLGKIILSFHMPLFFFISGYTIQKISISKAISKGIYFLKPQIFIGIMNCVWYYVIIELLLGQVYNQRWFDYFSTWFLQTMFYVLMCYALLHNWLQSRGGVIRYIIMVLCLILTCCIQHFIPSSFDRLHLLKTPFAFLFFMIGVLVQQNKNFIMKVVSKYNILFILLLVLAASFNQTVYWYNGQFGNLFLTLVSSVCGCFFVLHLSILIGHNSLLSKLGKNSIVVYSCQFLIYRVLGLLILYIFGGFFPNRICNLITFFFSMIVLFPITNYLKDTFLFRKKIR